MTLPGAGTGLELEFGRSSFAFRRSPCRSKRLEESTLLLTPLAGNLDLDGDNQVALLTGVRQALSLEAEVLAGLRARGDRHLRLASEHRRQQVRRKLALEVEAIAFEGGSRLNADVDQEVPRGPAATAGGARLPQPQLSSRVCRGC